MANGEPNFLGLFSRERDVVTLKPGETLFKKGDSARCMYVVLSGGLRVGDGNVTFEEVHAGGNRRRNGPHRSRSAKRNDHGNERQHPRGNR